MSNLDAFFKKKPPSRSVSNPPPLKPVPKIIPPAPKIDKSADEPVDIIESVVESTDAPPQAEREDIDLEIEEEPESAKKAITNSPQKTNPKLPNKMVLICENKKCKYQRIFVKSKLDPKDKICPKCGGKMHQKPRKSPPATFRTL